MRDDISEGRGSARWLLLVVILCITGCSPVKLNAGFPEVALEKPPQGAPIIGVARAEDSRGDRVAGTIDTGMRNIDLLVGPELPDYIERKLRNELTRRGFAPVEAINPMKTSLQQPYKVVVVTLQSVSFGFPSMPWDSAEISISIAIQVYSPTRELIYASSFPVRMPSV